MSAQPIEDLFGSSSAASVVQLEYITTSKTFKANRKGKLSIFAKAGDGSGAVAFQTGYASGAGAAECAYKTVDVEAGDEFVVTLGVGGVAVSRNSSGVTSGNPGTDTTIVGPGVNMTIKGGGPGIGATALPVAGGLGGRGGTGGDEQHQGGDGGPITNATAMSASGSGAVNVKGLPPAEVSGGAINSTNATSGLVSGGAGVGGKGASVTGAILYQTPAGGGYGGPAVDNLDSQAVGRNAFGVRTQASPAQLVQSLASFGHDWFGGGGQSSTNAGPGGGGGGRRDGTFSPAGNFGGPGPTVMVAGTSVQVAGAAGNFGPGASAAGNPTGGNQVVSGAGAPGYAVFVLRA